MDKKYRIYANRTEESTTKTISLSQIAIEKIMILPKRH